MNVLKKITATAVFIAVLMGILFVTSQLFIPKNNTVEAGVIENSKMAYRVFGEKSNSLDVVFVGDSEVFGSFIPLKIWKDYGITSFDLAEGYQKLYQSEDILRKVFKNQKPKIVFLETLAIYDDFSSMDAAFYKLEDIFPVFRYHNRWKSLKAEDFSLQTNYTFTDGCKGYSFNDAVVPASTEGYMSPCDDVMPISKKCIKYVERIKKLCEENGAKLVLVSTPSTANWNSAKHNGIVNLAQNMGLQYMDMNLMQNEITIDFNTDSRDGGDHLNNNGALKVSAFMGKYLSDMGIFEDKRQNPDYQNWNDSLADYINETGDWIK